MQDQELMVNCQLHFCDAQAALRKSGALTVQEALHTDQIVKMVSGGINQALMMTNSQNKVQQEESSLVVTGTNSKHEESN
eukprot:7921723-Ditylum_brightwellii.AAC.2